MAEKEEAKPELPQIIQLVNLNDITGIKNLLLRGEAKVGETDNNGMTALHHAAYKGYTDICKLLLDHGADINDDSHDHRYSPLHFAALSGNIETVQLLLTSGARTYHTNTLGRTATQMAAFVGNHTVVALINNYLPISDVEYYTQPHGLEKEGKLPSSVSRSLYDLIMQVNLHPVKIALTVEDSKELQNNMESAAAVLNLMCEKESKRSENVNEVICIKFHYLAYVLKTLSKELKKSSEQTTGEKDSSILESIIRKWLRGRTSDGYEEYLEFYIRDAIKAFPYVEMPLFIQLVQNISGSNIGDSWALGVLSGCINGQRAFQDDKECATCGQESKEARKCSKCKYVQYCNRRCQKLHWVIHKKFCDKLFLEYQKREKQREEERLSEEEQKAKDQKLKEDKQKQQADEKDRNVKVEDIIQKQEIMEKKETQEKGEDNLSVQTENVAIT
ncbi:Ankyrin repeat and MYND domain-containing protein 2 [Halocaridina rubra]|uniref:Ankyrin repeat and MYND domain-containing protein 2 n=1 Tax=Halocaridina rubra TaxID=373956 RepID=A0AAN8XPY7_HALRR